MEVGSWQRRQKKSSNDRRKLFVYGVVTSAPAFVTYLYGDDVQDVSFLRQPDSIESKRYVLRSSTLAR